LFVRAVPRILRDLDASPELLASNLYHGVFAAEQLLVTLMTFLGVLLTFGLVFPPIAVAMLVSIYAVAVTSKVEVGRFLTHAIDQNLPQYVRLVEMRCKGVGSLNKLPQAVAMVFTFACFYYAPFLFDTLGDSVRATNAAWVIILLCSLPFVVRASLQLHARFATRGHERREPAAESAAVELQRTSVACDPRVELGNTEGVEENIAETRNIIHA
jgi:hypothetical protein